MAGLRDIIVHQYFGIKLDVIWKVIQDDLPGIEQQISRMLGLAPPCTKVREDDP
jgi:uncharacterized protein with HEPN domain